MKFYIPWKYSLSRTYAKVFGAIIAFIGTFIMFTANLAECLICTTVIMILALIAGLLAILK